VEGLRVASIRRQASERMQGTLLGEDFYAFPCPSEAGRTNPEQR
jgi:hypothetical protein